jgi:hypothetical protein
VPTPGGSSSPSSGKHAGRGGNAGWAGVAKFFIVIGVLVQLSGTVVMAQALREHWDALRGEQPGPPAAFYLSSDARSLTLEGGINDGVAGQLEAILARSPRVTTLVLASGGGWTREGRLLGDIVAARGLNTHVATECSSACTLAFLAGKVRSASEDAQLGFHRFGPGDRKTGEAAARKAYARLLMKGDFILKVTDTSPDDMWYPEAAELVGYKVLTQAPGQAVPAPGGALTKL